MAKSRDYASEKQAGLRATAAGFPDGDGRLDISLNSAERCAMVANNLMARDHFAGPASRINSTGQ